MKLLASTLMMSPKRAAGLQGNAECQWVSDFRHRVGKLDRDERA